MRAGASHPQVPGRGVDAVSTARAHRIRRSVLGVLLALACLLAGVMPAAAATPSQAQRVVQAVTSHIGARYVHGSTGPRTFDCSGLVFRSFKEAGLARRIGGFDTAHGYYNHFRRLGRMSRVAPRVGDLVVYASGGHVGIYVGGGKVVSALLSGVKRHPIRGLNIPFTGILRINLNRGTTVVPAAAKRTVQRQVVLADRRLPLRADPRRGSRALDKVRKGTKMVVFGHRQRRGTTWIKVRVSGGGRGWVNEALTTPR